MVLAGLWAGLSPSLWGGNYKGVTWSQKNRCCSSQSVEFPETECCQKNSRRNKLARSPTPHTHLEVVRKEVIRTSTSHWSLTATLRPYWGNFPWRVRWVFMVFQSDLFAPHMNRTEQDPPAAGGFSSSGCWLPPAYLDLLPASQFVILEITFALRNFIIWTWQNPHSHIVIIIFSPNKFWEKWNLSEPPGENLETSFEGFPP